MRARRSSDNALSSSATQTQDGSKRHDYADRFGEGWKLKAAVAGTSKSIL
jgi:hypothetical protein